MADMLTCIPVADAALTCVLKNKTVLSVSPDPSTDQDRFQVQLVEWLNQVMSSVKVLHQFLLQ